MPLVTPSQVEVKLKRKFRACFKLIFIQIYYRDMRRMYSYFALCQIVLCKTVTLLEAKIHLVLYA